LNYIVRSAYACFPEAVELQVDYHDVTVWRGIRKLGADGE
jgi:hypothetical protein